MLANGRSQKQETKERQSRKQARSVGSIISEKKG